MIPKELIAGFYYYGLTIITINKNHCLMDIQSGECFENMSIYYMRKLLNNWNKYRRVI